MKSLLAHCLRRTRSIALATIIAVLSAPASSALAQNQTSDGPYLLYRPYSDGHGFGKVVFGLKGDSLIEWREKGGDMVEVGAGWVNPWPQFIYEDRAYPEITSVTMAGFRSTATVDTAARIMVISDLHGDFDHLTAFLLNVGVVDSTLHWSWGDGRLVVVGDIFDRGAQVTECLWFLCGLQIEAWFAEGRVHVLLGNHELMVMRGDLRYVNEKYTNGIVKRTGIDYDDLYGWNSELGRWLRSLNTVMMINDVLFVHGGLAPWVAESSLTMAQINDSVRAAIDVSKEDLAGREFPRRLYGTAGPFWYRGYHYGIEGKYPVATAEEIDAVLEHFNAAVCVVGHSEVDSLTTLFEGRVIGVDVPVEDLGGFEGLLWEDGQAYRVTVSGRRVPLELHRRAPVKSDRN